MTESLMTDSDKIDQGILTELNSLIRLSHDEKTSAIPELFAEIKGKSGFLVAERQARWRRNRCASFSPTLVTCVKGP